MAESETYRFAGTVLPSGERREVYVAGGRVVEPPAAGATTVSTGGWIVPGLVDAHCHIGLDSRGPVGPEEQEQQAVTDRDAGALLVRDAGSAADTRWIDDREDLPKIIRAGRHIARSKRYIRNYGWEIEPEELTAYVEQEAKRGDGWVKLVGDWIDRDAGDLLPCWPADALQAAIAKAHECGARVTAHVFGEHALPDLLAAGIDCIEHGTGLSTDLIDSMAAHGTALVPTLLQLENFPKYADQAGGKFPAYAAHMLDLHARRHETLRAAVEAGVPIYAGTDAGGVLAHGLVGAEIAAMPSIGMTGEQALAAGSWAAREWLGAPSALAPGDPADLLVYASDPRADLAVLRHPSHIVLRGNLIRGGVNWSPFGGWSSPIVTRATVSVTGGGCTARSAAYVAEEGIPMGRTAPKPTARRTRTAALTAVLASAATAAIAVSGVLPGSAAQTAAQPPSSADLDQAFDAAAGKYDVPRDLLVGIGYAETHLDGHAGKPSASGGYGVMHLATNPQNNTLGEAAKITGLPLERLTKQDAANIAGAAAVLGRYADQSGLHGALRDDSARWYAVVARYSHSANPATARLYADEVYRVLNRGVSDRAVVAPTLVRPVRGDYEKVAPLGAGAAPAAVDYPNARWVAASGSNYQVANRPSSNAIDRIVIHTTQGSYAGTISWFQNPSAQVSAHYVIRSSDGEVTQMVREKDIAWHVRSANPRAVGIEHEGFVDDPSWYTDAMYRSSAAVTRDIANRQGIPKDRTHIVGHSEVPGNDHTDPGPNWDWNRYLGLVNGNDPGPDPKPYNFSTWGSGVNVRSDALLSAPVVTTIAGPTRVFVECQKQGDTVTVDGYTNNWWSKLRDQGGFITNIYIDHPAQQLPDVPLC